MSKTVFLVAGGTGGHVFPAISLAEELISRGINVECITDNRGERFFRQTNLIPHIVTASAWATDWPGKIKAAIKIIRGIIHSLELCQEYRPACVVGFGGYPSFPTIKAAQLIRIPTVLHEQNAIFGRANRQVAPFAKRILTSFDDTKSLPLEQKRKIIVTGNPVRRTFAHVSDYQPYSGEKPINLLVFSGSQGSALFSQILPDAIGKLDAQLRSRLNIVQQSRADDVEKVKAIYQKLGVNAKVQSFYSNMTRQYEQAHLIIARAGASTITEIMATGRPGIFIPLAASLDGDQAQNAMHLVSNQAGWMIEEKNFTPETMAQKLDEILKDPAKLQATAQAARALSKPDAVTHIADIIMKGIK